MAFFGLTRLGEQNLFQANSREQFNLSLFDEADFVRAFEQIVMAREDETSILAEDIVPFLQELYLGPMIPEADYKELFSMFEDENSRVSKTDVMAKLVETRAATIRNNTSESGTTKSSELTSNREFRERCKRNERLSYAPGEKYSYPITTNHEMGWEAFQQRDTLKPSSKAFHPRIASNETKFADAMVANGVY